MAQEKFPTNVNVLSVDSEVMYEQVVWKNGVTPLDDINLNKASSALNALFGKTNGDAIVPKIITTINNEIDARKNDVSELMENDAETQWALNDLEQTHAGLISSLRTDVNSLNSSKVDKGTISHSSETQQEGVTTNGTSLDIVINAYTKEETDNKVSEFQQSAEQVLNNKVDSGTITHTSEGISEGVTRTETSLNIVVDAYTKNETDSKIAEAVKNVSGETSADSVKADLDAYKQQTNTELTSINRNIDDVETNVSNVDQRVTVLENTVNNIPKDVVRTSDKLILRCGSATENLFQAQ